MDRKIETFDLVSARESLYRFLVRLYILEVDLPLLEAMQAMVFPECVSNAALSEGYGLLREYLSRSTGEDLEDLAVDYANIFLAAGVAQGSAAFPYESVYVSKTHMLGQEPQSRVAELYAARGFALRKDLPKSPEDHISMELEYMACLCRELGEESSDAEGLLLEQKEFFKTHLANWIPLFSRDVTKYAQTDFYRAVGKITDGFIQMEQTLLQDN